MLGLVASLCLPAEAADYGTCAGVVPEGRPIALRKEHARVLAGTKWEGRWCNPRFQGPKGHPKGDLIREFGVLPAEGLYAFGSLMMVSYFKSPFGTYRWPKESGYEKGLIFDGKVSLNEFGRPWRLNPVLTAEGCVALTWVGKDRDSGAATRNYVQNCDPAIVKGLVE